MPISDTRKIIKDWQHNPQKSLGQHFLLHEDLARKIVRNCQLRQGLGVVEIGPGLGIMTRALLQELEAGRIPWIDAVEKDENLVTHLRQSFENISALRIFRSDFFEWNWRAEIPAAESFQVVANLPYNVATEILFHLIDARERIPRICVMVQKEVAGRLRAQPGTKAYGRLSLIPQVFYSIEAIATLSGNSFYPPTKVDSEFIVLERRAQPLLNFTTQRFREHFERLISCIFRSRRKTLLNSLRQDPDFCKVPLKELLAAIPLDERRRGETLSIAEMGVLAEKLSNSK